MINEPPTRATNKAAYLRSKLRVLCGRPVSNLERSIHRGTRSSPPALSHALRRERTSIPDLQLVQRARAERVDADVPTAVPSRVRSCVTPPPHWHARKGPVIQ